MTASPTVDSVIEAVRDTHLVILTDWEEFRSLDLGRVGSFMRTPIVVVGRNLFEPTQCRRPGSSTTASAAGRRPSAQPRRVRARCRSCVTVTPGQNSRVPV